MRTALVAILAAALIAAAPAAGATRIAVKAPKAGAIAVKLTGKKKLRVVAGLRGTELTEPRTVKPKHFARLPLTRAGKLAIAACGSGKVRVTALSAPSTRSGVKAVARQALALPSHCTPQVPEPADLDIPDGASCDQTDPALCLQPFPSNRFTVKDPTTDTGLHISFPASGMPADKTGAKPKPDEWNRNDGFSPGSAMVTKVPGLDTPEALARTGAVPIDDIARSFDAKQPVVVIDAKTGQRWPVWTEIDINPKDTADRNIIIRPAKNFLEGHRYVVALRKMRDASGKIIRPSVAFGALRDGTVTTNAALEKRRAHFESLFGSLARAGVARGDLYLAWDFTIASERNLSERMLTMRNDAYKQLGDTNLRNLRVEGKSPTYAIDRVTDDPDGADGQIMRKVEGHVDVPCYLNSVGCGSGGTFNYVKGLPAQMGATVQQARFTCNIPRIAANGAPLRVGIYGHGLLGSRDEIDQSQLKTLSQDHGFMFCSTDWSGMACTDTPETDVTKPMTLYPPDCDIPTVATILLNVQNFPKLADRVQQGMLNFMYLGRALIHADGFTRDPAFQINGKSVIDTSHLYYDGNSQGGIIGGALIAVEPDLDRGDLGVTGMNYSTLLRRSVDFNTYAAILYNAYPDELERPVLLQLLQMLWDRAEANGYAEHMTTDPYPNTPSHRVLMHIGFGDHQVSNYAAKVEARTIGAHAFSPWTDPGRDSDKNPFFGMPAITGDAYGGSAIVMWDSGSPVPPKTETPPSAGEDPHELPRRSPLGQQQKSDFFKPGGTITDVCGASPCYAGSKAPAR